ncbi:hypothetical protein D3C84_1016920 [compost metagenome]
MGRHGEMPLWRASLQQITDADLFMQIRRNQAFALYTDAEKIIRGRTRQTVGADMHLAGNIESQRQMLSGPKYRESGVIGGL